MSRVKRPQLTGRAAVLAVVVCAIAMSLAYPVREYIAQRRNIAQLEQEKARELAAIKALEDRRRQLQDPGYIKRQARERLFYCEPGQKCYVVMDDRPGGGAETAAPKKAAVPPWYQTLWESVEAADTGKGRRARTGEEAGASRSPGSAG
ncbi:septum formation initiator family protein [Planomonospora corallina]|uniref:Septum formation initiator family protein n=1 Tax=Planomonospora corallina TaxID=1806052 RepID=A0ABV8I5B8_9ACTN